MALVLKKKGDGLGPNSYDLAIVHTHHDQAVYHMKHGCSKDTLLSMELNVPVCKASLSKEILYVVFERDFYDLRQTICLSGLSVCSCPSVCFFMNAHA